MRALRARKKVSWPAGVAAHAVWDSRPAARRAAAEPAASDEPAGPVVISDEPRAQTLAGPRASGRKRFRSRRRKPACQALWALRPAWPPALAFLQVAGVLHGRMLQEIPDDS